MTGRTANPSDARQGRVCILAALYGDRPPPGATPEILREWARLQVDRGWREGEVAVALGWTVDEVRRTIGERPAA